LGGDNEKCTDMAVMKRRVNFAGSDIHRLVSIEFMPVRQWLKMADRALKSNNVLPSGPFKGVSIYRRHLKQVYVE
jgi:hypothetical protein